MFLTETETPETLLITDQIGEVQNKPVLFLPERYWKMLILALSALSIVGLYYRLFHKKKSFYNFKKQRGF